METIKTVLKESYTGIGGKELVDKAFDASPEEQRFLWHSDKLAHNTKVIKSMMEDDDKICYSTIHLKLCYTKHLYFKTDAKSGFTYDKKTKKVSIWFGKNLRKMELKLFYEAIGAEWFMAVPDMIRKSITKTMLGHIISKKVNNPKEYVAAYLKSSHRGLKVSPGLLLKYFREKDNDFMYRNNLFQVLHISKTPDATLQRLIKMGIDDIPFLNDTIKQALQLGHKLDFKWSNNRFKDMHAKWTRDIMKMEMEFMGQETLDYEGKLTLPEGWTLLADQKAIFEEGTIQKHCIYTNYWSKVRNRKYFVLSIAPTAGVSYDTAMTAARDLREGPHGRITVGIKLKMGHTTRGNGLIDQIQYDNIRHPNPFPDADAQRATYEGRPINPDLPNEVYSDGFPTEQRNEMIEGYQNFFVEQAYGFNNKEKPTEDLMQMIKYYVCLPQNQAFFNHNTQSTNISEAGEGVIRNMREARMRDMIQDNQDAIRRGHAAHHRILDL